MWLLLLLCVQRLLLLLQQLPLSLFLLLTAAAGCCLLLLLPVLCRVLLLLLLLMMMMLLLLYCYYGGGGAAAAVAATAVVADSNSIIIIISSRSSANERYIPRCLLYLQYPFSCEVTEIRHRSTPIERELENNSWLEKSHPNRIPANTAVQRFSTQLRSNGQWGSLQLRNGGCDACTLPDRHNATHEHTSHHSRKRLYSHASIN